MTTINTPAGINMWVMLSRRHQVQLHLKGLKGKGIINALKRDVGDHGNRVANYVVPIEYAIAMAGGETDYKLVNVHVLRNRGGMFFDFGIYNDMTEVEANPKFVKWYSEGSLEIVLTTEPTREPTKEIFVPA